MEFLMDPSIWAGLLTLVVLEIVLGIDNLVFIAILADKLPPKQRDKARLLEGGEVCEIQRYRLCQKQYDYRHWRGPDEPRVLRKNRRY